MSKAVGNICVLCHKLFYLNYKVMLCSYSQFNSSFACWPENVTKITSMMIMTCLIGCWWWCLTGANSRTWCSFDQLNTTLILDSDKDNLTIHCDNMKCTAWRRSSIYFNAHPLEHWSCQSKLLILGHTTNYYTDSNMGGQIFLYLFQLSSFQTDLIKINNIFTLLIRFH